LWVPLCVRLDLSVDDARAPIGQAARGTVITTVAHQRSAPSPGRQCRRKRRLMYDADGCLLRYNDSLLNSNRRIDGCLLSLRSSQYRCCCCCRRRLNTHNYGLLGRCGLRFDRRRDLYLEPDPWPHTTGHLNRNCLASWCLDLDHLAHRDARRAGNFNNDCGRRATLDLCNRHQEAQSKAEQTGGGGGGGGRRRQQATSSQSVR
jgi:hypothetical protein